MTLQGLPVGLIADELENVDFSYILDPEDLPPPIWRLPRSLVSAVARVQLTFRKNGEDFFIFDANLIPIGTRSRSSATDIKQRKILNRYPRLQKVSHKARTMRLAGTYFREEIGKYVARVTQGAIQYRGENIFSPLYNYMNNAIVLQVTSPTHNFGTWVITDIREDEEDFFESASQRVKWAISLVYEAYGQDSV